MAKGLGAMLAAEAPPPDKMMGKMGAYSEDEGKEAAIAEMETLMGILGVEGDAAAACESLDRYLTAAGFKKA